MSSPVGIQRINYNIALGFPPVYAFKRIDGVYMYMNVDVKKDV
jgi:hypothetical protein